MATIILKLDTRRVKDNGQYPIVFQISHKSKVTTVNTGISIRQEYWCGEPNKAVISKCPNARYINTELDDLLFTYSARLRALMASGDIDRMTLADVKQHILARETETHKQSFTEYFNEFAERKDRPNTQIAYRLTLSKLGQFAGASGRNDDWEFVDITLDWLKRFDLFLKGQLLKPNGIAFHMRNLRAVVNSAIDDELMTTYPFRKFKIKREETAKRSLSVEDLRKLRDYPCEPHQEKYRDLFMLTFYLLGINPIDLFALKEIINGRIEYRRSKTGHLFSIK